MTWKDLCRLSTSTGTGGHGCTETTRTYTTSTTPVLLTTPAGITPPTLLPLPTTILRLIPPIMDTLITGMPLLVLLYDKITLFFCRIRGSNFSRGKLS